MFAPVGVVLAGGASKRFGGRPKGLAQIGAYRMLDNVTVALTQTVDHVILASNDVRASEWKPQIETVVRDIHPGTGGLAGVEAAFKWAGRRDLIVVAWDMPFVNSSLLVSLIDVADATDADVVVPESESPHGIEPFCAFYSHRVRKSLTTFLSGGGGAAHEFVRSRPRWQLMPTKHVARSGDPKRLLFSVNTPDDLEQARAMHAAGR